MTDYRPLVRRFVGPRRLAAAGRELGVHKQTVWRWLQGTRKPNAKHVLAMLERCPEMLPELQDTRLSQPATVGVEGGAT